MYAKSRHKLINLRGTSRFEPLGPFCVNDELWIIELLTSIFTCVILLLWVWAAFYKKID